MSHGRRLVAFQESLTRRLSLTGDHRNELTE
jgi:hypothetical protein